MHKIVCHINRLGWCYQTMSESLKKRLKDEFVFVTVVGARPRKQVNRYDLFWSLGLPVFINQDNCSQQIRFLKAEGRAVCTVATGNKPLASLLKHNKEMNLKLTGVIGCNQGGAEMGKELATKVWMIPNGVEIDQFTPERPFCVGYAGRNATPGIRRLKGVDIIKPICQELGIPFKIRSSKGGDNSPHEQMPDFYRSISVYWGGSSAEGCSNSIMEAMATALPVITTEGVGYHGEVCKDGIEHPDGNIVFISPERTPEEVKEKLLYLKENPGVRERIGYYARRFAEEHSWDIIAERYREMFREAIRISQEKKREQADTEV